MKEQFNRLLETLGLKDKQQIYNGRIKDFYVSTTQYNANDSWYFEFEFDAPVDIESFRLFVEGIEALPESVQAIKNVLYKIEYINNDYSLLEDYYDYIIGKISKKRPRFNSILDYEIEVDEDAIEVLCPKDAHFAKDLLYELKPELARIGFDCKLSSKVCHEKETIEQRIKKHDKRFKNEVMQNMDTSTDEIRYLNLDNKIIRGKKNLISSIPMTENDLNEYKSMNDKAVFSIEGEITSFEARKLNQSTELFTMILSDEVDSIYVKKFAKDSVDKSFMNDIKEGMHAKVKGVAQYDRFTDSVTLIANIIEYTNRVVPKDIRKDVAPVKRIELHVHTKMSTLDGIDSVGDYVDIAKKWGHKAIAITDHGNVQGFPELFKTTKDKSIKPIYGAEFTFIDEEDTQIVKNPYDVSFDDAVFTVFDIETTGLSVNFDKIIEIAAVKIKDGHIVEEYQTYVNPQRPLSMLTTKLTSIKNADVQYAPLIETVIHEFKAFFEGTIMVAHNAHFDMGFIENIMKKFDIYDQKITSIDTLSIARNCYSTELKRFNLKAVSRYFKVELTQHHRAIYDTRATADIFLHMLRDAKKQGVKNLKDFNLLSEKGQAYKHVISKSINLLVKNETGLKNLFQIVSEANTNYFYRGARLLKRVLDKYRDGILVGSGCMNSAFFEIAMNKTYDEMKEAAKYYDYLELQPVSDFLYLKDSIENVESVIKETFEKIIKVGEELNIPVVATGDTYHISEQDAKFRDIYVQTNTVGGGFHPLARYDTIPSQYFRTTEEMLHEFSFLSEEKALEIVVANTHLINDKIDFVQAFKKDLYAPTDDFLALENIPSIENKLIKMVHDKSKEIYGEHIPVIVKKRIQKEIESITKNKFSTVYYISHLLVKKSLDEGYLVGSRGSVGSSLVATLMDITEVNPLAPHYVCPKCHFSSFKMTNQEKTEYGLKDAEIHLQSILDKYESGFDLPSQNCPICGEEMNRDGHSIPFETFLGFKGDKVPDIDLNFSGDYQPIVHEYIRTIFGKERAFRAGTISTIAEKTAFGYVKGYLEKKNIQMRKAEMERRSKKIVGVKRSTGQHPGGIVVVPNYKEITDVTPVQFPADDTEALWRTTHFDYHSFEDNLFKLDVLGHDDPTMIKFLMDYVKNHQDEFNFSDPRNIPIDDEKVYKLLNGTEAIGLTKEDLRGSEIASFGIPEMGTKFVRDMLRDSRPNNFADVVKISGLSHGTDVWLNNAKTLVNGSNRLYGKVPFKDVIGCRDDIMVSLIGWGMKESTAFEISEFIRKGKAESNKVKWETYKTIMSSHKIPDWYIWSCGQIKYMFPKAHATAYVLMAMRIAWFKLYKPILFYSAYFSIRATHFDVYAFQGGEYEISKKMDEIEKDNFRHATEVEKKLYTVLEVANEMVKRGFKFKPIDINKSMSKEFVIDEDGKSLILPFITVDGLGLNVADSIVNARNEKEFKSKDDIKERTSLSKTLFMKLELLNCFDHLPDNSQLNLFSM
jgi:DNA polymerase-3 subunit alpha (Gram-positive type)